ncbi:hypothetical protein [Geopseudomonas aromaticivorans]
MHAPELAIPLLHSNRAAIPILQAKLFSILEFGGIATVVAKKIAAGQGLALSIYPALGPDIATLISDFEEVTWWLSMCDLEESAATHATTPLGIGVFVQRCWWGSNRLKVQEGYSQ